MSKKMTKCPTWFGLRKVTSNIEPRSLKLRSFITEWPENLQPAVALALSVAHWSPESRADFGSNGLNKQGDRFATHSWDCGLCTLYYETYCIDCPLAKIGEKCERNPSESLWTTVNSTIGRRAGESFHAAADALYNKLVELYTEEWEKL